MKTNNKKIKISEILLPFKQKVDLAIKENIAQLGPKNKLRDACDYALTTGGKRFRPCLVLMIAEALKKGGDVITSALGIEFLHTASLIADDLPSMDNDDFRRERASLHKQFDEASALLASYSLISSGYHLIVTNGEVIKKQNLSYSDSSDTRCLLALKNVSYNTGINGATGGQFMDISPGDLSMKTLLEIIHKKTTSLFEISFVLGWLFGGGEIEKLEVVKQAASHFGLIFQLADDLNDMEQDQKNRRQINVANVFGKDKNIEMFHVELERFFLKLKDLGLENSSLVYLGSFLKEQVNKHVSDTQLS